MTTRSKTEVILKIMRFLSWVAFMALIAVAGAILISYGISWVNPVASKNLYMGLDLSSVMEYSFWHYSMIVFNKLAFVGMKAAMIFLIIKTLSAVNLESPFKIEVVEILEKVSYTLVATWAIAMLHNAHIYWLLNGVASVPKDLDAGEFLFTGGLVFIVSQVFRRGVEIQSENELTV